MLYQLRWRVLTKDKVNVILMCLVLTAVISYLQRDINVVSMKQLLSIPSTLISRCRYETTAVNTKHINITL
jgi:hypothetical protein